MFFNISFVLARLNFDRREVLIITIVIIVENVTYLQR